MMMMGLSTPLFSIGSVIAFIASFVLSLVMYNSYVIKPERSGSRRKPVNSSYLQRLVQFSELIVGDLLRWAWTFLMLFVAFEGIVISLSLITMVGYDVSFLIIAILNLVVVLLIELLLRALFELHMLTVLIQKDTSAIHEILANQYGEPSGSQVQPSFYGNVTAASAAPQYSGQSQYQANAPAQAQMPAPVSTQGPSSQSSTEWVCPSCGQTNGRGSFCKHCGSARP